VESPWFAFSSVADFLTALRDDLPPETVQQIQYLSAKGLPPIVSEETLATMVGINAGIVWSFANRSARHYQTFTIPKGHGHRTITAPRVGLKIVQKWLSHHIAKVYVAPAHVCGFVPSRSHIEAAFAHRDATWAYSVDIRDFFVSTPQSTVLDAYHYLGYDLKAASLLAQLSCFNGALSQGSPTSPTLSNICFRDLDVSLVELAQAYGATITRYADDIVFSGAGTFPEQLKQDIERLFEGTPWELAPEKSRLEPLKGRIKVHGLIVSGEGVRLTKGYRNKLRAYEHILRTRPKPINEDKLWGHVEYSRHVRKTLARFSGEPEIEAAIYTEAGQLKRARSIDKVSNEPVPAVYKPDFKGFVDFLRGLFRT
jgi:RNA-directed DNA polymerase